MSTFTYHKPGIGNASSYIVSGTPWYTSSLAPALSTTSTVINLPRVTNSITIKNTSTTGDVLRFTLNDDNIVDNTNYITLEDGESFSAELRVVDVQLISDTETPVPFTILAGLTNIDRKEMYGKVPSAPNLLAWVQKQKLVANDPDGSPEGDYFGATPKISTVDSGKRFFVSSFGDEGPSGEIFVGALYVFEKVDDQYVQTEKIDLEQYLSGAVADFTFAGLRAVNSSGDKILISIPPENSVALLQSGSAGFELAQTIEPNSPLNNNFGTAEDGCAFSSDDTMLIISSPFDGRYASSGGTVSVFVSSSSGYQFAQEITASYNTDGTTPDGPAANDFFGTHTILSQDKTTLIIGCLGDDEAGSNAGAAYVFRSGSNGYQQVQKLTASYDTLGLPETTKVLSYFGEFLSSTADLSLLAIGARNNSENGNGAGAVYIFASGSSGYQQIQKLTASNDPDGSPELDEFSIPILSEDGTVLAVCARNDEQDGGSGAFFDGAGAVYMFHSGSSGFQQVQKLTSSFNTDGTPETPGPIDYFAYQGGQLADDGKTFIAGATSNGENGIDAGAVYIFKYTRDY